MSVASRHKYRFGYLKSEKWQIVRLEALVREKGKCEICKDESIFNDAHHVWYPSDIYQTTEDHLAILCRDCHTFIHAILPECKTREKKKGIEMWTTFKNSIIAWRMAKLGLFESEDGIEAISAVDFKKALAATKQKVFAYQKDGIIIAPKCEIGNAFNPLADLLRPKISK